MHSQSFSVSIMSIINRLFDAVCSHDPVFAASHTLSGKAGLTLLYSDDPETETALRRRLCGLIKTQFNPAVELSAKAPPPKSMVQTTLFKTKLAAQASPTVSVFSIHSLRHQALADRLEKRAKARNTVAETIAWLSHILLCMDPATPDPQSHDFSLYIGLIYTRALTMGSSPYNPFRIDK